MERVKIKDRIKGWRAWRQYMGLLREQGAMLNIFMQKKRIYDTRKNVMAWRDQVRWRTSRLQRQSHTKHLITDVQNWACSSHESTRTGSLASAEGGAAEILARNESAGKVGAAADASASYWGRMISEVRSSTSLLALETGATRCDVDASLT
jgi:hypothetical protein